MNGMWHARTGIVARGCARGRIWSRRQGPGGRSMAAAGNDRFTAVGQWIKRASQADLARLHAPWDPMAGRYRAPDEKTIRVVLDRLDPRALARALLGGRPDSGRGGGPPSDSVRGYHARRADREAKRWPAAG